MNSQKQYMYMHAQKPISILKVCKQTDLSNP